MSFKDLFPPNFVYKTIEEEFVSLSSFKCVIRGDINSGDCFESWLREFEERTSTSWNLRRSKVNDGKGFVFSRDYICHHSSYRKRTADGKNKSCNASITIRIKNDTRYIRCRDVYAKEGLLAILKIDFRHSHRTDVEEAWNWLRRSDETISVFNTYFNKGMSPSAAKMYHESMVLLDGPEQLANSQRNPPLKWIYQRHEKWMKENFGGLNIGTDFQLIAKKKAETLEAEGNLVFIDYNPFCVVIVTPLMKRILESLNSSHSVFIDSSASCDQAKSSITLMLVATKAGAVPIAVCIHASQDEKNYERAFKAAKTLWGQVHSFNIENFMTDDCLAMKKALLLIFPDTRQLLCQFHVLQAVWRWIWNAKNKIANEDRKPIMQGFRRVVFSKNEDEYNCNKEEFLNLENVNKYKNIGIYVSNYWNRKDEWCLAFRLDIKNDKNNTNNYAEASVRIFKEIVLCRLKAFNSLALMDFVANVMEKYYSRRLLDVAFGRLKRGHLLFQKYLDKGKTILDSCTLRVLNNNFYEVQSESSPEVFYVVGVGVCNCIFGLQGAFCKHQAAIHIKYGINFPNSPNITSEDKKELAFIATGNKSLRSSFLDPMMPDTNVAPPSSKSVPSSLESISSPSENVETTLGDTNEVTTHLKKKHLAERFGNVMKSLTSYITEDENVDTDIVEKFLQKAENIQSGPELNRLLNPFSSPLRPTD